MNNLEGQTFAGYEVLTKLGEGGMGSVWKARQPMLNRLVALKMMAPSLSGDPAFVARFIREASAAANLNHPNMVQVYTAGENDKIYYIAMEFVEGESLRVRLDRMGRVPAQEAVAITVYVAQALQYAWNKAHLIHRDIKPDNIFLSNAGEVKVGDLGLAKSVGSEKTDMTQTGMLMGSPHYISPEQAQAAKDLDFRTDIYSLGCTLYHMLTGKTPYQGDSSMAIVMKHVNEPAPAIFKVWPQCPMPLGRLVGKMVAKHRQERHASYEDLLADLMQVHEKLRQSESIAPVATTPAPTVADTVPRAKQTDVGVAAQPKAGNKKLVYAAAGACAAVALAGLLWWSPWKAGQEAGGKGQAETGSESRLQAESAERPPAKAGTPTVAPTEPPKQEMAVSTTPPAPVPDSALRPPQSAIPPAPAPQTTLSSDLRRGLALHFSFDADSGDKVPDSSGMNNHGTAVGAKWTADGKNGGGFVFDRNQHYITVPHHPSLNPPELTTAAWIKTGYSEKLWLRIFDKCFTNGYAMSVAGYSDNQSWRGQAWWEAGALDKTKSWICSTARIDDDRWHHVVGTMSSPDLRLYVDGVLAAQGRLAAIGANTSDLTLGLGRSTPVEPYPGFPVHTVSFSGIMDDVMLYDRALSAEEVKALFESQGGKLAPTAAAPSPPQPAAAAPPADDGFQPLFNGRDLAGWVPMKSSGRDDTEHEPTTDGWNVRDGELVCATNQTGWLKTERQYGDYVLRLEFKLLRDCNSDVYIRCPTSGHIARAGMAIQVIDPNYRGKQMPPDKLTGAIYGVVGSPQPPVRPPGEWNSMEIRCEGDTVEVTLNGTRTALANMSQNPVLQNRPRSGYIGVGNWHGEASGMSFRNIRIKELGAAAASAGKTKLLDMGNGVKMELIAIPPGEFLLGSTPEERQWAKAEAAKEREGDQPRRISMKNGFWLGRTEVTVGQWKRFVAATDYKTDAEKNSYVDFVVPKGGTWGRGNGLSWRDPGHGTPPRDDHPVCAVSWNDAMAFCRWLTEQERSAGRLPASHVVRLPTEAEWEYACRAGTQTRFWWGDATEDGQGRLNGTGEGDGFHFVAPVDHYGPRGRNAFGLADMLGNAYEWCLDDCDARQANEDCYKGNPAAKVLRGGSFNRSYEQLRCAARISNARTHSSYSDGFRVCLGQDMIDSAAAASTPAHAAAAGQNTINLLPLVDPQKDAVKGDWKLTSDGLVLEQPTGHTALDLPYAPPEEYDFEIEFTPTGKGMNVNQFLFAGGRSFAWKVARKEEYAVIELLDGKYYDQRKEGVSEKTLALEAGRRYISKVEVRRGSFRTLVNGEEFLRWSGDFNRLSLEPVFKLHDDRHIGVGSVRRGVIFHRIEVREVTGKGTFARGAPAAAASTTPALQHSNLPADLAAFCAEVAALPPVQQVARVVAKLKELNPNFDGKQTHKLEAGAVTELAVSTVGLRNLAPVSALKQLKKLTIAPWAANQKGALSDLSPLRELPLAWLYCQNNPITDLSPLKGLPLTVLGCGGTQVTELSPLAGMKLTVLSINDTAVNDLSPLSGAPLTVLWCNNTKVADFSPLGSSPLQELRCDYQPQRDAGALRGIPTLRKLNDQPAAVLLKQAPAATAGGDIRVLIVTGVDLPSHDWRATGPAIRNELQKDPRMKVEILNDIYRLDSTDLSKFQAVLLNFYTRGKPDPNEQARENLKNFVNRGGGLIVFHSTCGSFRDWPEFRDLAGKVMDTQKSYDKQGPMRVKIASANHPITRGMQPYETNDELYAFLSGRKAVQVLATARARSTGSDEPMAFVFDYGKGRVFHFVLGHDVRAIQTEGTAELLRRGAAWVAGREPATTTKR